MDWSDVLTKLGLGCVVEKIGGNYLVMVSMFLILGVWLIWQGVSTVSSEYAKTHWGYKSFFKSQIIAGVMAIIAAIGTIIILIIRPVK